MSAAPPDAPPVPAGATPCPRCGAAVGRQQDWCLDCGFPVRTRVAPTPRWRVPIAILATIAALALAALAVAFVDLTEDPEVVTTPSTTTVPPAGVPTTPPAAGVPTTPPATTTPAPTATAPAAPEPPGDATGGTAAP